MRFVNVLTRACAIILLLPALAGCRNAARANHAPPSQSAPMPSPAPSRTAGVTLHGKDYRIIFPPDGGPRVWEADVTAFTGTADAGTLHLTGIACTMYQAGKPVLKARADAGEASYAREGVQVMLRGHVRADAPTRGLTLMADAFRWSSREDRITASRVQWSGLGLCHVAAQGVFSTDLTRSAFSGGVRTDTVAVPPVPAAKR